MKTMTPKPIKKINVPIAPPSADASDEKLEKITLELSSEVVLTYNDAAGQEKAWKKIKEDTRPMVADPALHKLYAHNTANPTAPVKTVRVVDGTGAACNVSLKDTYGSLSLEPEKTTISLFMLGQSDPNVFVAEKVVIGFNTKIFYDSKGNLDRRLYLEMMEAIQDVADDHGVESPFTSTKVVTVKDGFAEKRWEVFTEDQQPAVSELFPATVSLAPQVQVPKKG